jgi:hypothetical protein
LYFLLIDQISIISGNQGLQIQYKI